jgi:hypothetical protein
VVIEIPPMLLGGVSDIWQAEIAGIRTDWPRQGQGRQVASSATSPSGPRSEGYLIGQATTYRVVFGVRGFQAEGKTDHAVALMKGAKIYALARADARPEMAFSTDRGRRSTRSLPIPLPSSRTSRRSSR